MSTINQPTRRTFVAGALAALALPAFAAITGCSSSQSSTTAASSDADAASSSEEAKSADASSANDEVVLEGDFVLGFDQDFPPYGYVGDDGEYTGFDIELARAVCEREGWTLELKPINWDLKDTLLNSGEITCIWNGFTIEGREDGYAFTAPYMENRQVIVVKTDSGIESLKDLEGKKVLTQADSAALELLSEGGAQEDLGKTFGSLETIGDYNTAFMQLESGQVDAIAVDQPVATFNIGDRTDTFIVIDEPLNSEHFGVGFKKGDEALAERVEQDLVALTEEGVVKDLCEKYSDQGVSYDLWMLK